MSEFYKIPRSSNWNYNPEEENNFKLSRSKLELFIDCPRCFYLDNRLGLKRPPGYPFNLNSAVDELLKKEFDIHRAQDEQHPLQVEYGVDARPVDHKKIDTWRETFEGVRCFHKKTGLWVMGAIDDLWINSKDQYIVVDYKSTSKNGKIDKLDQDWHQSYKRQMEIYQWLLRKNNLEVSNTGYFVYANGITDKKAFDKKLEFEITLIDYIGDDSWVEKAILEAHQCLEGESLPESDSECEYCQYRELVGEVEQKKSEPNQGKLL